MAIPSNPREPWNSFFRELDAAIDTMVRLDCLGGFVVTQVYGLDRPTADVDVVEVAPRGAGEAVLELGMRGGPLHRKHLISLL
jgi:ketol-acid reductoisomerase